MSRFGFLSSRNITTTLVLANTLVLVLYVAGWSSNRSKPPQQNHKSIARGPRFEREPIELIEPKIKGKAVNFEQEMESGPDWLKDITFKVKNVSNHPITFIDLIVRFPETTAFGSGGVSTTQLMLGQRRDYPLTASNPPLFLLPRESITLSLEKKYGNIQALAEAKHIQVSELSKVEIRLNSALFADGTLYSGGGLWKQNPDTASPRKWIRVADAK